jgi:hypothetical protein
MGMSMPADIDLRANFSGLWRMSRRDSKVLDPMTGEWVQEVIQDQVNEILIDGSMTYTRVRIVHADNLTTYLGFKIEHGIDEWVPYTCFHIEGDLNHEALKPNNFRKIHERVGEPISYLRLIYVDPRTQYRVTRHVDGSADYMMQSRLAEDLQSRIAKVWAVDSTAAIEKHLIRDRGAGPEWPKWTEWPE